jgi:2-polyprenyl-6-methoxyphenol hydroxylase-like FAD-dependent oxidoreductase
MSQLLQAAQSWMSSGDVIGNQPDRQVLVVGDTIVGHTLTLLLEQAGFDPLLATASDGGHKSEIAYLWSAAVQTLEFVDVDLSTLEYNIAVDNVSVRDRTETMRNSTTDHSHQADGEPPMVVPTNELHELLNELSGKKARNIDRRVETLASQDDGAVIEFADGIREWFDLVLYADSPETAGQSCRAESVDTSPLTQYEVAVSGENLSCDEPEYIDVWQPEVYFQSVPRQTSECLIRITVPQGTAIDSIPERIIGQLPVEATTSIDTALTETSPSTVRQRALADQQIDTGRWGNGRVGYCGQAVCAMIPASGFGLSFGIEDALAFVTELARNDGPGTDVVTTYADQRAHRLRTLLRTANLTRPNHMNLSSLPSDSPLETVGLLRSVSLAPLFGGKLRSVQRAEFSGR